MQKRSRSRSSSPAKKKTKASSSSRSSTPRPRKGYGSVARTRGAAVSTEIKYFDCEMDNSALFQPTNAWINATISDPSRTINLGDVSVGFPLCLFAPKPTASLNGRIGRKVAVRSIEIRGQIASAIIGSDTLVEAGTHIRILLVLDKQTNATQMYPGDVLNGATNTPTTINSYLNPNSYGRFVILKDIRLELQPTVATGDSATATITTTGQVKLFNISHKFKTPLEVDFNVTNGGTVADIINNSFHVMAGVSDTSLSPTMAYYSRVCYTDA